MKQLVEDIAKALVDVPEEVSVREVAGEQVTVLELKVAPSDLGKVIGKQGRTARSIRTILGAAGMKVTFAPVAAGVESFRPLAVSASLPTFSSTAKISIPRSPRSVGSWRAASTWIRSKTFRCPACRKLSSTKTTP